MFPLVHLPWSWQRPRMKTWGHASSSHWRLAVSFWEVRVVLPVVLSVVLPVVLPLGPSWTSCPKSSFLYPRVFFLPDRQIASPLPFPTCFARQSAPSLRSRLRSQEAGFASLALHCPARFLAVHRPPRDQLRFR